MMPAPRHRSGERAALAARPAGRGGLAGSPGRHRTSSASRAPVPSAVRLVDLLCVLQRDGQDGLRPAQSFGSAALPLDALCRALADLARPGDAFSLALPHDGMYFFCAARRVREDQVLCAVARTPALLFLEQALSELAALCEPEVCSSVVLEPFVRSLVYEVPCPPVDRTMKICWEREGVFERTITIGHPRIKHLPLLDDRGMRLLFAACEMGAVLRILEHLLAEDSIVLHSATTSKLAPVAEALRALLFPMIWQGIYLPLLPEHEWRVLQASVPLLVGLCTDAATVQMQILARAPPTQQGPRRFVCVNLDSGQTRVFVRPAAGEVFSPPKAGSPRSFAALNLPAAQQSMQQPPPSPVPQLPPVVRDNLLSQVRLVVAGVPESEGLRRTAPEAPAAEVKVAASAAATTATTAGPWPDFVRIAVLEAMLSVVGRVDLHLRNLQPDFGQHRAGLAREGMPRSASACALAHSALSCDTGATRRGGLDPEAFLEDMPAANRAFAQAIMGTRMFAQLVAQMIAGKAIFTGLCKVWRNYSVGGVKRKTSPLMLKLQAVLAGMGYSFAATRVALDALSQLTPEEMNGLFVSVRRIQDTLEQMGVPRYIESEDSIPPSPANPRTAKLRSLLQRSDQHARPPLVCRIALSKQHPTLPSSWSGGATPGRVPRLAPEIVEASTGASLPPCSQRPAPAAAASAHVTALCLASCVPPHAAVTEYLSCSSPNQGLAPARPGSPASATSPLAAAVAPSPVSPGFREPEARVAKWCVKQVASASIGANEALLAHIDALRQALADRDARIEQLERQVAGLVASQTTQATATATAAAAAAAAAASATAATALGHGVPSGRLRLRRSSSLSAGAGAGGGVVLEDAMCVDGLPLPIPGGTRKRSNTSGSGRALEECKEDAVLGFGRAERRQSPLFIKAELRTM